MTFSQRVTRDGVEPHLRGRQLSCRRCAVGAGGGRGTEAEIVRAAYATAPHHLDVEVASTVRGLAAGKKITDRRGEQMLADYSRLRITRHPVWPYHPRMWELRHNLGAYDAAYIALAEALGCELLTGDVKLKNAAGHHATVIVSR